jgi:hypothetical protein
MLLNVVVLVGALFDGPAACPVAALAGVLSRAGPVQSLHTQQTMLTICTRAAVPKTSSDSTVLSEASQHTSHALTENQLSWLIYTGLENARRRKNAGP